MNADLPIALLPPLAHRAARPCSRSGVPTPSPCPGGKIGINLGMLRVARTPDPLAAVIGHEIGPVLADHSNERLTQELAVQRGLMLVDLLAEEPGPHRRGTGSSE